MISAQQANASILRAMRSSGYSLRHVAERLDKLSGGVPTMSKMIEVDAQDAALLCEAAESLLRLSRPYSEIIDAIRRVRSALQPKAMGDADEGYSGGV